MGNNLTWTYLGDFGLGVIFMIDICFNIICGIIDFNCIFTCLTCMFHQICTRFLLSFVLLLLYHRAYWIYLIHIRIYLMVASLVLRQSHDYYTVSEGTFRRLVIHDDVIKWKHFPRPWTLMRRIHRSAVDSPHKGQWRRALIFSLICAWKRLSKQSKRR